MAAGAAGGVLRGLVMPVTIIGAILVFVVPIPPGLLDVLLSANLTVAVVVLLTTLAIRTPQEFSAFPTILLTTTLTRLVLNVATARLVLTRGASDGLDAAGGVIRAFGEFVAGDQVIVGVILFSILVVIQFVVITQGATRISEVAARFMLDGLPGRQMAIDADLHAGLIDQHEAHRAPRRGLSPGRLLRCDGRCQPVRPRRCDRRRGHPAGQHRRRLVPGHGQSRHEPGRGGQRLHQADDRRRPGQPGAGVPDLAGGGSDRDPLVVIDRPEPRRGRPVFSKPGVLGTAAVFLGLMALTPLPKLPLLDPGRCAWARRIHPEFASRRRRDRRSRSADDRAGRTRSARKLSRGTHERPGPARGSSQVTAGRRMSGRAAGSTGRSGSDRMEDLLHVDPLELEIGFRLIGLADPTRGGDLLDRLKTVRQRVAREMGLIVPQVRIHDQIGLAPNEYRVKIRGTVVGQGIAYAGRLLAVPPAGLVTRPDGRDGVDPVTGQPAVWIHADGREVAELAGCRVLEAAAVVAGHFGEIVANHADELLTREQVERLLDRVRATAPTLAGEVVPGLLRAGELQRVLQNLLRERVSIRDLETILETLAVHAGKTKDIDLLTEQVRQSLARQITESYRGRDGRLRVVTLARPLDARLAAAASQADTRPAEALGDETIRSIVRAVALAVGTLIEEGFRRSFSRRRRAAPCSRT